MTKQLREALAIARERLERDADAYADEDIIGRLVAAIDAAGLGGADTASLLLLTARQAAAKAADAVDSSSADGTFKWAKAAETALNGYRLAPVEPVVGDDAEREEMGRMIRGYREAVEGHRALLVSLAQTFGSANTPTAARVARRIETHLAGFGVQVPEPGGNDDNGQREP